MAFIYGIKNIINNKLYIGKTLKLPKIRFKEHILESKKSRCCKRPLYDAMNKYGIKNFKLYIIEEVKNINILDKKEQYYINKFNTYNNGYNATQGGEGSIKINYKKVLYLYNKKNLNQKQVAQLIGCSQCTIHKILKNYNIDTKKNIYKYRIKQYNLNNNYIQTFENKNKIIDWLIINNIKFKNKKSALKCITDCCNNKTNSSYNYKWKKVLI